MPPWFATISLVNNVSPSVYFVIFMNTTPKLKKKNYFSFPWDYYNWIFSWLLLSLWISVVNCFRFSRRDGFVVAFRIHHVSQRYDVLFGTWHYLLSVEFRYYSVLLLEKSIRTFFSRANKTSQVAELFTSNDDTDYDQRELQSYMYRVGRWYNLPPAYSTLSPPLARTRAMGYLPDQNQESGVHPPPPPHPARTAHTKDRIHRGWYASCAYAGELSCLFIDVEIFQSAVFCIERRGLNPDAFSAVACGPIRIICIWIKVLNLTICFRHGNC